jgi:hypothetical protein
MPQKYFWAGLVARVCYFLAIVSVGLFVAILLITKHSIWELLLGSLSLALSGLLWDVLSDIGERLYHVQQEQVLQRNWMRQQEQNK